MSVCGGVLLPGSCWGEQNRAAVWLGTDCPSDIFAAYTHQTSIWPLSVQSVSSAQRERWGRKRTLKYVHRRKSLQALNWAEQCVIRAAWGNDAVAEFSSHWVSSVGYITLYVCPSHSFSHFLPPSLHPLSFSPWRSAVSTLHYLFQSHRPVLLRGKPPIPPPYIGGCLGQCAHCIYEGFKTAVCVCVFAAAANICLCTMSFARVHLFSLSGCPLVREHCVAVIVHWVQ